MLEKLYDELKDKIYKETSFSFGILLTVIFSFLLFTYNNIFFETTGLSSKNVSIYKMANLTLSFITSNYYILGILILMFLYWLVISLKNENEEKYALKNKVYFLELLLYGIIQGAYLFKLGIKLKFVILPVLLFILYLGYIYREKSKDVLNSIFSFLSGNKVKLDEKKQLIILNLFGVAVLFLGMKTTARDTDNFLFIVSLITIFWFFHNKGGEKQDFVNYFMYLMLGLFILGGSSKYLTNSIKDNVCENINYGAFVTGTEVFYSWKVYEDQSYIWLKEWDDESPSDPASLFKVNKSAISYIDDYSISGKIDEFDLRFKRCIK